VNRASKFRRMTTDVLRLTARTPLAPVQRRMALAPLAAARQAHPEPPPWTATFTKGYALVTQDMPVLRQAYFPFPIAHIHEYPLSAAAIAVERTIDGESVVAPLMIQDPASLGVDVIGSMIREAKTADIQEIPEFRRAYRVAMLPWLLRVPGLWAAYHIALLRADFFGTFGVSVIVSDGGELINLITPQSTGLTYGPFAPDWTIDVRITFDHRLVDAAPIARALVLLEEVLNGAVAEELRTLAARPQPELSAEAAAVNA
jgi:hypothetical protein